MSELVSFKKKNAKKLWIAAPLCLLCLFFKVIHFLNNPYCMSPSIIGARDLQKYFAHA